MKIISTRARVASLLLALLTSALVLGGTLTGITAGAGASAERLIAMDQPGVELPAPGNVSAA